ncbi:MAG: hydrogenase formation protein HypD [Anaerolineaceae bacterium]|nr:hydrogenase formation protein HypD [Anaerolineaceae bacterium]
MAEQTPDFLSGYRNAKWVKAVLAEIHQTVTQPWTLMEICGGQTHAIMQYGLDQLLPEEIELVHGPGCPVCVTSLELIDQALMIAKQPDVIFTSFGDMLRVPGSKEDLFSIRAAGGQVRVVYSPMDAVKIAAENPDKQVVFFAIGFETTAPANAMAVIQAEKMGLDNFSILPANVLVPPAMHAILSSPSNRIQGFLAAGHVCAIMGYWEYPPIAEQYKTPMAVTGFEPLDLVEGILQTVKMLEESRVAVENAYSRVVTYEGNKIAQAMLAKVFKPVDRNWRGIGTIPLSGYGLQEAYQQFDAAQRFDTGSIQTEESKICIAGQVLQGIKKPSECPAFGTLCTPQTPLGAPMVSSEGACAAYYRYGRKKS